MKKIIFVLLVFFISLNVYSQGEGGGPDPDIPIDGGIGILLGAGMLYAVKKIKKK